MRKDYTNASLHEVLQRAEELVQRTLRELYGDESKLPAGKGSLGQLVESLHFGYAPNSSPLVDFPVAGLELKVTGVIQRQRSWRAKERLVLSNINYSRLANENSFVTSSFLAANGRLLVVVYHWLAAKVPIDYRFLGIGVLAINDIASANRVNQRGKWR